MQFHINFTNRDNIGNKTTNLLYNRSSPARRPTTRKQTTTPITIATWGQGNIWLFWGLWNVSAIGTFYPQTKSYDWNLNETTLYFPSVYCNSFDQTIRYLKNLNYKASDSLCCHQGSCTNYQFQCNIYRHFSETYIFYVTSFEVSMMNLIILRANSGYNLLLAVSM